MLARVSLASAQPSVLSGTVNLFHLPLRLRTLTMRVAALNASCLTTNLYLPTCSASQPNPPKPCVIVPADCHSPRVK